ELPAERVADLAEDACQILVGANVALCHERARHGLRKLADALLDPLALVRERELRAAVCQPLRDRPCDRAAVRDPPNQPLLSFVRSHPGRAYQGGSPPCAAPARSPEARAGSARPWRAPSPRVTGTSCYWRGARTACASSPKRSEPSTSSATSAGATTSSAWPRA